MSKAKRTKKKAGKKKAASKKKASAVARGSGSVQQTRRSRKLRLKGERGLRRSSVLANKAKREGKKTRKKGGKKRRAANAKASGNALTAAQKLAKKNEFLARMKAAREQRATEKPNASGSGSGLVSIGTVSVSPPASSSKPGKKRRKKAGKRKGKAKATAAAAPRASTKARSASKRKSAAPGKKKRRKVGSRSKSRKASTPKFQLMHKWGFPSRRPLTKTKRSALRGAAGGTVTANQILQTVRDEKLKSWVCVGPRRTGCGGGAKNLRGGHQVGIFAVGKR